MRALITNGQATDFDACYLDDLAATGSEVVEIMINDLPDGYLGEVAWDPLQQRIYPHPNERLRKINTWRARKSELEVTAATYPLEDFSELIAKVTAELDALI